MTTERQKRAIVFCEAMGCEDFHGDKENFSEVSAYLSENLEYAKSVAWEIQGLHPYDVC